ncbi:hypothetical protein JRQ81_019886 [Phrynocephalus forsythii]|uniref:Uncharacterized protein n=1 Tax=Phrynocephalus forsythii TaxID=171643 RepID=A0A9Q1AZ95_9SAUR|nr:hypothetical protein JRQ81_019886 [Phrynocephalus forsythii]
MIKNAFPKPNLLWFLDGKILKGTSEGVIIETEDTKVAGGFYEMKSLLTIWKTKHPSLSLAFKCMSVYPFPGSETRNISSEDIFLPPGWQPTTMESLKTNSHATPSLDSGTERNLLTRKNELTMQMNHELITNGLFNNTGNLSTKIAMELTTPVSPNHLPTIYTRFNNNDTAILPGQIYFSWPALVTTLLFFCMFLILLGVRKWCQYQKEIMNRPPSFKPPPPPVKYTSMQGSDGIYTSCNELENL